MSISIAKERASRVRELVEAGRYPTISALMDSAVDALLEQDSEQQAWWAETMRRCEQAEKHPERLLDADTFFREVRAEIETRRKRYDFK